MDIQTVCFTENGYELAQRIASECQTHSIDIFYKKLSEIPTAEICAQAFAEQKALLFIGATGIAIRMIAPFVRDKLTDPPVLVMDEKGLHVIPLLSGHVGGANELALELAQLTGADPVITTATDLNRAFSVDLFAKEHGLGIVNREGIAKVSVKALEGKPIVLSVKDYPPAEPVDVLITDEDTASDNALITLTTSKKKRLTLGIGCRKGAPVETIEAQVLTVLGEHDIDISAVHAVATIDIKKDEEGLLAFCRKYSLPLITFDADMLNKAQGDFAHSDFVLKTTGTDNVCERAAVLAAGPEAQLTVRKTANEGVTVAIACGK